MNESGQLGGMVVRKHVHPVCEGQKDGKHTISGCSDISDRRECKMQEMVKQSRKCYLRQRTNRILLKDTRKHQHILQGKRDRRDPITS